MTGSLESVFNEAIRLVAKADWERAEAENRRKEALRRESLDDLGKKVIASFDFSGSRGVGMEFRVEIYDDRPGLELLMRREATIFVLLPKKNFSWDLCVSEKSLQFLAEVEGAQEGDSEGRRLAAARVIIAIANWLENRKTSVTTISPEPGEIQPPLLPEQDNTLNVAPEVTELISLIAHRMEQNRRPAAPSSIRQPAAPVTIQYNNEVLSIDEALRQKRLRANEESFPFEAGIAGNGVLGEIISIPLQMQSRSEETAKQQFNKSNLAWPAFKELTVDPSRPEAIDPFPLTNVLTAEAAPVEPALRTDRQDGSDGKLFASFAEEKTSGWRRLFRRH